SIPGSTVFLTLTPLTGQNFNAAISTINSQPLVIPVCVKKSGPFDFNTLPLNATFTLSVDSIHVAGSSCNFTYLVTDSFNSSSLPQKNIIRSLCKGETLTIGTDVYSEIKPTGTTVIPSGNVALCDSLINVNLTFKNPSPVTAVNRTTCDMNFSLTVGSSVFNASNPSGQVLLKNFNGCDSLVMVNITFSTFSSGQFNFSSCDQTYFYNVGGVLFDKNNPTGSVTLTGASASGCDSVVQVNLEFLLPSVSNFKSQSCNQNFTFTIGNTTFDKSNQTGTVTLSGQAENGCDSIINVTLTFLQMATGDIKITTCNDNFTYTGNNIVFDKSNPSGSFVLSGAATNGCDSVINVELSFRDFNFGHTLTYNCDDENAELVINQASQSGPYTLSIDNVIISSTLGLPFNTEFVPGNHFISLETTDGCRDTLTINVTESIAPIVDIIQTLLTDGSVQLNVIAPINTVYDLKWTPSASLSCPDCFNPTANPTETTTYTLDYLYGNNCPDSLQITVERFNTEVVIPNIFSPNGDNTNDEFYVHMPEGVNGLVKIMQIYDRWGNLLFNNTDRPAGVPGEGWKGDKDGVEVQPGVYVFYIEIQIEGKVVPDKYYGDITVVR
ncbi:MAG: gliding motility-associated C-terminal domain-containing protein, partial [Saprospiraceae bacterium]|nr:gliding motility-associated C-terminal domain-containing protein [Saprospiraceae bacterium]